MDLCKTILTRGVHVLSLSDSITALRVPPARPSGPVVLPSSSNERERAVPRARRRRE